MGQDLDTHLEGLLYMETYKPTGITYRPDAFVEPTGSSGPIS